MNTSKIYFRGEAYEAVHWHKCLRELGLLTSGGVQSKAIYSLNGSSIVGDDFIGFNTYKGEQCYTWKFTLKHTRRWEGTIKYFAVLLAAFTIPQDVEVEIDGKTFSDYEVLLEYSESKILELFDKDELVEIGVYKENYGFQFS